MDLVKEYKGKKEYMAKGVMWWKLAPFRISCSYDTVSKTRGEDVVLIMFEITLMMTEDVTRGNQALKTLSRFFF